MLGMMPHASHSSDKPLRSRSTSWSTVLLDIPEVEVLLLKTWIVSRQKK